MDSNNMDRYEYKSHASSPVVFAAQYAGAGKVKRLKGPDHNLNCVTGGIDQVAKLDAADGRSRIAVGDWIVLEEARRYLLTNTEFINAFKKAK